MLAREIISACWIIFMVYWFINAWSVKATAERQSFASQLLYRLPLLAGYVLLYRVPHLMDWPVWGQAAVVKPIGAGICILGLAVAIWARKTIAGNWSSAVVFKESHELVERGPYRYARHPIYTGILLMTLGTAVAINRGTAYIGVVLCFIGFWIKLKQEEKLLMGHFPAEYPAYRARVKALVPFVF